MQSLEFDYSHVLLPLQTLSVHRGVHSIPLCLYTSLMPQLGADITLYTVGPGPPPSRVTLYLPNSCLSTSNMYMSTSVISAPWKGMKVGFIIVYKENWTMKGAL